MGKPDGFFVYERKDTKTIAPLDRIKNYQEFHLPLQEENRRIQASRCMDCGVPFCQYGKQIAGMSSGCPLHNVIPEWNDLLYRKNYEIALERLLMTNPFPEFTSRVCPAPCEKACTCSLHGDAVTICENEKFLIEYGFAHQLIKLPNIRQYTGKKVAIIGSGPSGLACAQQLHSRHHEVHIYERSDRAGGLLMYGIPNMKLDKAIVNRRIALMEKAGIHFHLSTDIDTTQKVKQLQAEYDAIILAVGSSKPRNLSVKHTDAKGVHFAVDYLSHSTKHLLDDTYPLTIDAKDKHVVIVGGGDTGNDCVATAIRQSCASVVQLEMMPELPASRMDDNPWPEWSKVKKTDYGQEEAIAMFDQDPRLYEVTIKEIITDENHAIKQVVICSLQWEKDGDGNMRPSYIAGSEKKVACDLLLLATGFVGVESNIFENFELEKNERGVIQTIDGSTTNIEGVFVSGDASRGQSLVVWAMQEGKKTAKAVDTYLMGYSNL
ncbi:glutamate synthase (NADPH/NADH) small chain [Breznakia blatticola]|uniref:Glutamate synthase (NADPH/NADH) small chain n=1 Tax=Breznakia blatticola TaxID=1754012 RepID=A0A4R7ZG59_9FIRM|nr:glutamate synthase subunit beta [Breznakia blatticola]TDW16627.1 glutamate synthase (NADPH/NADH) small chain [Breznakia blatticola]